MRSRSLKPKPGSGIMVGLSDDILSLYVLPLLDYDDLNSFSLACRRWMILSQPLRHPLLYEKLFAKDTDGVQRSTATNWKQRFDIRKKYRLFAWGRYFGRLNGASFNQPTELIDRGPVRSIFLGPEGPGVVTFEGKVVYRSWRPHEIPAFIYNVFPYRDDLIAIDSKNQAFLLGGTGLAFRGQKIADDVKMIAGGFVLRTTGQVSHHGSLVAQGVDQISSNGLYLDWNGNIGSLTGDTGLLPLFNEAIRGTNERFTKLVGCNNDTYMISNHGRLFNWYENKLSEIDLPEAAADVVAGSATNDTRPQVFLLTVTGTIYAYGESRSSDCSSFGVGNLPNTGDTVRLASMHLVSRGPAVSIVTDGYCTAALMLPP